MRIPAFHHLWWWTWVVAFLLGLVVGVVSAVSGFRSGLSGDPATTTVNGPIVIVGSALYVVAAALGAVVVRRTTERQDERAGRLGLLASPGRVPAAPQAGGVR